LVFTAIVCWVTYPTLAGPTDPPGIGTRYAAHWSSKRGTTPRATRHSADRVTPITALLMLSWLSGWAVGLDSALDQFLGGGPLRSTAVHLRTTVVGTSRTGPPASRPVPRRPRPASGRAGGLTSGRPGGPTSARAVRRPRGAPRPVRRAGSGGRRRRRAGPYHSCRSHAYEKRFGRAPPGTRAAEITYRNQPCPTPRGRTERHLVGADPRTTRALPAAVPSPGSEATLQRPHPPGRVVPLTAAPLDMPSISGITQCHVSDKLLSRPIAQAGAAITRGQLVNTACISDTQLDEMPSRMTMTRSDINGGIDHG
jgi:hypothetical protein